MDLMEMTFGSTRASRRLAASVGPMVWIETNTLFVAGERRRETGATKWLGNERCLPVDQAVRGPSVVLQVVLHQMMVLRGGVAAILKGKGGKNGYYPSYPEVPRDVGFFVPPRK